jgi:hypothetical protein
MIPSIPRRKFILYPRGGRMLGVAARETLSCRLVVPVTCCYHIKPLALPANGLVLELVVPALGGASSQENRQSIEDR